MKIKLVKSKNNLHNIIFLVEILGISFKTFPGNQCL